MATETTSASTSDSPPPQPAPEPTPAPVPTAVAPAPAPKIAAPKDHTVALAILKMLERTVVWLINQLAKPKPRVVVVGAILIIVGAFFIDHSVWTFPLVIIGAVMIISAWVGTRLEGRFGIEWGDGGAGFEMRARFRPALELQVKAPHLAVVKPIGQPTNTASSTDTQTGTAAQPEAPTSDVIEGEAHTIEIDVEELKALVAAAERANNASATTSVAPVSWHEVPVRRAS